MAAALVSLPRCPPPLINPKPYPLLPSSSSIISISISISRSPNGVCLCKRGGPLAIRAVLQLDHAPLPSLEISKLGISDQIVDALSRRGITELFPIQRAVLEPAMEGRDMIGRAITGSGKTLAFGIPILNNIIQNKNQNRRKQVPSALVLAPTRELARQVQREFKVSAPGLSSTCLYGGIPIMNQVRSLEYGMDIVVGTPGRIIDLVQRGALDLSEVKFVVLDEADQMLAVGFQEDVECILSYLPARRQCMLFSATMPSWVNDLSRKYLRNPLVIDLVGETDQKLADGISLYSVASTSLNKQNLLPTLISRYAEGGKSIIFTRTKIDAESLSRSMRSIIGSRPLHGNMQQMHRDKTLAAFRSGKFNVLVATDVAARGLDIPNVDLVVHFEMPNTSEIFVHRSGRTGRAGNKGTAILMFTERERHAVRTIERELGCKFKELHGITGGSDRRIDSSHPESNFDEDYEEDDHASFKRKVNDRNATRNFEFNPRNNERFRRSSPRNFEPSNARYSQGRGSRIHKFDDFENNRLNNRNSNFKSSSPRNFEPNNARYSQSRGSRIPKFDDSDNNLLNNRNSNFKSWQSSSRHRTQGREAHATKRNISGHSKQRYERNNDSEYDALLDLFKDQY
ncbi:DEAD-box ATP-dependent RNA helicase 53-like [Dioscorea cayenensis subsp. rotundata]|uniref:DEAD-box ATP-dependent RNA helicase 53-like n=1 Tax=Dioscorea cayennensis subsp. rotundata TaxID=55577 RepID=A0AB40AHD8_DIOCR|nr:DEAD-box ATP-dependent RNA helicase 53-like [Dioscorea cayenensis subsp. rotundata]XP_039114321.1 DEAD-box ATP-dependent RNA helicase 53-like [Dioscorea cayenensis subsp. rotundata]